MAMCGSRLAIVVGCPIKIFRPIRIELIDTGITPGDSPFMAAVGIYDIELGMVMPLGDKKNLTATGRPYRLFRRVRSIRDLSDIFPLPIHKEYLKPAVAHPCKHDIGSIAAPIGFYVCTSLVCHAIYLSRLQVSLIDLNASRSIGNENQPLSIRSRSRIAPL